jgi:hypothetical protein
MLLLEASRFPILSSSMLSSLSLRPRKIDSIRRISGPPRTTSGAPSSPLTNTLSYTTNVTRLLHRQARRLTTRHTPTHTKCVTSSLEQTNQFFDDSRLPLKPTLCSNSGPNQLSDAIHAPNKLETPDLSSVTILSPTCFPAIAHLPPRPMVTPPSPFLSQ